VLVVALTAAALVALVPGGGGHRAAGPTQGHAEEGKLAPDFALSDARNPGRVVRLSDFRGQAVVLNWYASWCADCTKEIPAFQEALQAYGGRVVVIGLDYGEGAAKAVRIMDELGANYPVVLDAAGTVADHYRLRGIPATYFIDAQGILRYSGQGGGVTLDILTVELGKMGYSQ
jgi:peroxiredoxin